MESSARPNRWATAGGRSTNVVKKAVILYFPICGMRVTEAGPMEFYDKLDLKTGYEKLGVRVVPHAAARYGAYLAPGVILMPSYVNIGAYVDEGTMVDTWATVGSCAQIGKHVHLSGGVGIGGVLEPVQAAPVIVEDGCFVGSRCIVVEGAHVCREAVLGAGTGHHRLDEDHRRVGAGAQGVQGIRAAPLGRDTRLAREAVPGRRVSGSLRADHRAA